MLNQFSRTELLIGKEGISKLQNAKVAIFGIGGVGSFVVEGLVRAGIGNFILIDHDTVSLTNLNRQIIATHDTIGKYKVDVMKDRILSINPNVNVEISKEFYMPDSKEKILDKSISYVVPLQTISFSTSTLLIKSFTFSSLNIIINSSTVANASLFP